MHRTNIYLTSEQERALDARARAAGQSRSEIIRQLLDRELIGPPSIGPETEAVLNALGDRYFEVVRGLFDDDPDLRIEQ